MSGTRPRASEIIRECVAGLNVEVARRGRGGCEARQAAVHYFRKRKEKNLSAQLDAAGAATPPYLRVFTAPNYCQCRICAAVMIPCYLRAWSLLTQFHGRFGAEIRGRPVVYAG